MAKEYYNVVKFRIVYFDAKTGILNWRFERGYHVGNLYGGTVRLCVYKDKRTDKKLWWCVDPETGLALGEGRTRLEAADTARARLTKITMECYQQSVSDAKQKLVKQGLMKFDYVEGYRWLPPRI